MLSVCHPLCYLQSSHILMAGQVNLCVEPRVGGSSRSFTFAFPFRISPYLWHDNGNNYPPNKRMG